MAKTTTTSISVAVSGDGVAATYTPASAPITNTTGPAGGPVDVALSSGDNTITVPSGSKGMLLVPPATSSVVKKLKGDAGDTGFTIAPALPSVLALPTGTTSILINAASSETVSIHWL